MGEKQLLEITNKLKEILSNNGGVKFKNYPTMCRTLGLEIKRGSSSKNAQLNELKTICDLTQNNKSFIVTKIYDEPSEKVDGRINNNGNRYGKEVNNMVAKAYWENFFETNNLEYINTTSELNSNFFGYTKELFDSCVEETKREWLVKTPKKNRPTDKQLEASANAIKKIIDEILFVNVWNRLLFSKAFRDLGFNTTNRIKVLTKQFNNVNKKEYWHTFELSEQEFIEYYEFQNKFAKENNIKEYRNDKRCQSYSMRYANKSEYNKCMNEYLDQVISLDENNNPITKRDTLLYICKRKNYGLDVGDIMRLKRAFCITAKEDIVNSIETEHDVQKLIDGFTLSVEELIDARLMLIRTIENRHEKRLEYKSESRTIIKECDIGTKRIYSEKLSETLKGFETQLMFKITSALRLKS